ncbi:MAG: hypothetical protein RL385_3753, partial [Pseudomonadota bacterium]
MPPVTEPPSAALRGLEEALIGHRPEGRLSCGCLSLPVRGPMSTKARAYTIHAVRKVDFGQAAMTAMRNNAKRYLTHDFGGMGVREGEGRAHVHLQPRERAGVGVDVTGDDGETDLVALDGRAALPFVVEVFGDRIPTLPGIATNELRAQRPLDRAGRDGGVVARATTSSATGDPCATELGADSESIEVAPVHEGAVALLAGRLGENARGHE